MLLNDGVILAVGLWLGVLVIDGVGQGKFIPETVGLIQATSPLELNALTL